MPANDTSAAAAPAPSVNPDLKAVHTQLIALASELDQAVGRAKTEAEVNAILDELMEVNARVTALGRQLLTQQSERIRKGSQAVIAATADAKRAVKKITQIRDLVQGITKFLTLVDKLIDTAKLVV